MVNNVNFAIVAQSYEKSKIPYSELDCQAFVERVLADCGVKRNWRGSNHMWREAVHTRKSVSDWLKDGGIPAGALLFTVKDDGGEKARGYKDDMLNAAHVGIYTGLGLGAMHSTTGGVQPCAAPDPKRWTHAALLIDVDYGSSLTNCNNNGTITAAQILAEIRAKEAELNELLDELTEVINNGH